MGVVYRRLCCFISSPQIPIHSRDNADVYVGILHTEAFTQTLVLVGKVQDKESLICTVGFGKSDLGMLAFGDYILEIHLLSRVSRLDGGWDEWALDGEYI